MNKLPFLLLAIFIGLSRLYADDRPAVELKNKSSFQMESNDRNPFWPIGFKPAATIRGATGSAGLDIPLSAFVLSSITLDQGTHFAIINGKSMQEGQQFSLHAGTQTYQLKLTSIEDGQGGRTCQDREILVPLRRK
jgi:hypothetical protein